MFVIVQARINVIAVCGKLLHYNVIDQCGNINTIIVVIVRFHCSFEKNIKPQARTGLQQETQESKQTFIHKTVTIGSR